MPHIIVEYSVPDVINMSALCDGLHKVSTHIDALPIGGLRVRAYRAEHVRVGDGAQENAFVYVTVRIGQGRSEAVKKDIGDRLFDVVKTFTEPQFNAGQPLSLGLEIQEIEKDWTWKKNNIHQILKDKNNG